MPMKIIFSLFLTVASSYLLFQARDNFISGMNPYLAGVFIIIPTALLVINYIIIKRVSTKTARKALFFIMFLGVVMPIVLFFPQQPKISNDNPQRRYIDTSIIQ
jgi:drug/metabolite transporter (DMT)-like permease